MNEFFRKLIRGDTLSPPERIQKNLYQRFARPYHIEWLLRDKTYEAVFYVSHREYLARFSQDGDLMDYKVNMPIDSLPSKILRSARSRGEIMNAVAIHAGDEVSYEIIYRDNDLKRYLLLIDRNASIVSEKSL